MTPTAVDCPDCGSGMIVYGSDWIKPCEYCGNQTLEQW